MSAYLKKHIEINVTLLDFNVILHKLPNFDYASFVEMYKDVFVKNLETIEAPSIVGVTSLFSSSYYNMLDVAKVVKEVFPGALVVAGGGVPTNMYEEIFTATANIDALCYGEGEKPLLDLVKAADREQLLAEHPSWITRAKVAGNFGFRHDFIQELDEIPLYDYGILHVGDYGLSPTISTFAVIDDKSCPFHVATSRGCPHLCTFCASHSVHGRKMRYHSVARVREELAYLRDAFGCSKVVFQDDHFMADKKRALAIIRSAKELGLTAFFQSGLALYALDRNVLEELKGVGLTQLVLSVESGSDRVLREIMRKPLDLSIVKRVVDDCRELGIASDVTVLIGLPGETKQDIEDALAFLKTLDATWFRVNVATPLPGSEMLSICLEKGYLKGNYIDCDFKRAVIETEDFTAEFIQEKAYAMNLELNFALNADFRRGNYDEAIVLFNNVVRVKNDHAFAIYFLAKCHEKKGDKDLYRKYKDSYEQILRTSPFWCNYAGRFELPPLN